MLGLLGRKIGMTQIFDGSEEFLPISIIELEPSQVLQIKTVEADGYNALILGYQDIPKYKITNPQKGFFSKLKVHPKKYIYEMRLNDDELKNYKINQYLNVSLFEKIEKVDIKAKTKGKGFQGVIKKYHLHRGPMSHGSNHHRRPGSMGPIGIQRVPKGKKLPGKMGSVFRTIQNLKVIKVDKDKNLIYVKGSIPGGNNSIIKILKAIKIKKKDHVK